MKKIVLGLIVLSSLVFANKNIVTVNNSLLMLCPNKSDAVPAAVAAGIGNVEVTKDFMKNSKCEIILYKDQAKLLILKNEKVPTPNSFVNVKQVEYIQMNELDLSGYNKKFWVADFLNIL